MEIPQIKAFMGKHFPGYRFSIANPDFDIQAEEEGATQADEKARDIFCHTYVRNHSRCRSFEYPPTTGRLRIHRQHAWQMDISLLVSSIGQVGETS